MIEEIARELRSLSPFVGMVPWDESDPVMRQGWIGLIEKDMQAIEAAGYMVVKRTTRTPDAAGEDGE